MTVIYIDAGRQAGWIEELRRRRVQKHGDHDQSSHGNWATGVGDGAVPPHGRGHPLFRVSGYENWGWSHGSSQSISGSGAAVMGLEGWRPPDPYALDKGTSDRLARKMLEAIASDKIGSEEPLYHGFEDKSGRTWEVGDTFALPPTATSGDLDSSMGYGLRLDPKDQVGVPTVIEFPKGTPMVGYAKWDAETEKEFGNIWSEAIVSGRYRVTDVQMDRTGEEGSKIGYVHWSNPEIRIVTVEPTAVFDPGNGKWVPRG